MRKNYLFRDANKIFFGVLLTFILLTFLTVFVFYVLSQYFGVVTDSLYGNLWVNVTQSVLLEVGFLTLFFVYNKRKKIDFFAASRLKFKFDQKIFWPIVILSIVLVLSSVNLTGMFNFWMAGGVPQSAVSVPDGNVWELFFSVLFVALLPAVCEELVFRGMIYNALRRKFGVALSVILSAIMFALIHFSIFQTIHQLILGVVLALIVYVTGSIVYAMIFHFLNNFIVLIFSYFSSLSTAVTFDGFGTVEVLASLAIFVVGAGVISLVFVLLSNYTRRHRKYFDIESNSRKLVSADKKENLLSEQTAKTDVIYLALAMLFGVLMWVFMFM